MGARRLADAGRRRHRVRHLGDAFYRHAGLRAGRTDRLRYRADCAFAAARGGHHLRRPRGRRVCADALGSGARRRHRRGRCRQHALYRHVGGRAPRPHHLDAGAGSLVDPARRAVRRRGADGGGPSQQPARNAGGGRPPHACDRVPSLHRHGGGRDRSRSHPSYPGAVDVAGHARPGGRRRRHRHPRDELCRRVRRPPTARARPPAHHGGQQHVAGPGHVRRDRAAGGLQ